MDAIFQELDVAWGFHAATCEHIGATVRFFDRHLAATTPRTAVAPKAGGAAGFRPPVVVKPAGAVKPAGGGKKAGHAHPHKAGPA